MKREVRDRLQRAVMASYGAFPDTCRTEDSGWVVSISISLGGLNIRYHVICGSDEIQLCARHEARPSEAAGGGEGTWSKPKSRF